jgi:DNA-binding transcriptional ArsR family regulator
MAIALVMQQAAGLKAAAGSAQSKGGCHFPLVMTKNIDTSFFVMNNAVAFCRALSDETRWRIVRLVMDRALCVCELADILGMPQSSVSSHVQIIRKAGLLESETCGKWTYFRIARGHVVLLRSVMKHFPDGGEFARDIERAEVRLVQRESSCCPGPVKLAKTRSTKAP